MVNPLNYLPWARPVLTYRRLEMMILKAGENVLAAGTDTMLGLPSFVSMFTSKQKSTFFQPRLLVLVLPPEHKKQKNNAESLKIYDGKRVPCRHLFYPYTHNFKSSTSPDSFQFTFFKCTQKQSIKNAAKGAAGDSGQSLPGLEQEASGNVFKTRGEFSTVWESAVSSRLGSLRSCVQIPAALRLSPLWERLSEYLHPSVARVHILYS